jgi:hypothetical protein
MSYSNSGHHNIHPHFKGVLKPGMRFRYGPTVLEAGNFYYFRIDRVEDCNIWVVVEDFVGHARLAFLDVNSKEPQIWGQISSFETLYGNKVQMLGPNGFIKALRKWKELQ